MMWILYPVSFARGQHIPSDRAWIKRKIKKEELLDLLSAVINAEAKKTPGRGIIIGKCIGSYPPSWADVLCPAYGSGSWVSKTKHAIRSSRVPNLAWEKLEYQPDSVANCIGVKQPNSSQGPQTLKRRTPGHKAIRPITRKDKNMENRFADLESRFKSLKSRFGDLAIRKKASRSWWTMKQAPKTLLDIKGRRLTNAPGLSLIVNN